MDQTAKLPECDPGRWRPPSMPSTSSAPNIPAPPGETSRDPARATQPPSEAGLRRGGQDERLPGFAPIRRPHKTLVRQALQQLIATGSYALLQRRRRSDHVSVGTRLGRLVVTGAALSIDNLVVGFALGTDKLSLALAAGVIAVVSVAMSLVGLELGRQLGGVVEKWSEEINGAVLILVGVAIAFGFF
jgi:hypothetical protein